MQRVFHTLKPVFDAHSKVLILGSMPSPKSREAGFYYAHPQNRFWRVLARVLKEDFPQDTEQRRRMAIEHNIAIWDVLASCDIDGAADSSIKNPEVNDVGALVSKTQIEHIFTTGGAAYRLYNKYLAQKVGIRAEALSSTSAANARMGVEDLVSEYEKIAAALAEKGAADV